MDLDGNFQSKIHRTLIEILSDDSDGRKVLLIFRWESNYRNNELIPVTWARFILLKDSVM